MLDFVKIKTDIKPGSKSVIIFPEYLSNSSRDLMIRGHAFYAVWDEEQGLWSRDEDDVIRMIDRRLMDYASESGLPYKVMLLEEYSSGYWTKWHKYCKDHVDKYHDLDTKIIFSNQKVKKTDYATKTLPYPLEESDTPAYEEIISTLYEPSERQKIEWAIGAVISGDSTWLQKFMVFYGAPGTGKSTILHIIEMLFDGYYAPIDTKALGSRTSEHALETFKNDPLVGIEHEGNLSRIEDNARLNSIISHEEMIVNEKFKGLYSSKFKTFLFIGTNEPVKITNAKSGILRRLIDINPSGKTLRPSRYDELMEQVKFELGGIAYHCLQVYESLGAKHYNNYIPLSMLSKTNDFFNFMEDNYFFFAKDCGGGVPLSVAWMRYKDYCLDAAVPYPLSKRAFKDELKNYFREFKSRTNTHANYYEGFLTEKFETYKEEEEKDEEHSTWLKFEKQKSIFDKEFKDCPAQYANEDGKPNYKWANVTTTLNDLDTSKEHYVKLPKTVINMDFDLKDENDNKNLEMNIEAASKFPKTYAELSKSGSAIHLCYFYDGDPNDLSNVFADNIEIKKSIGNSSLRRKLTKCNDLPIATISSGLPLRERRKDVVLDKGIQDEKHLRNLIKKGLGKKVFPNTKPSVDYIYKILDDAYKSGLKYDVSDMAPDIQQFAMSSSHQAQLCMKMVSKMQFKSEEPSDNVQAYGEGPIIFYDIEIFPNLFIICWKKQGSSRVVKMINPKATDVENFVKGAKLVGFNNRRYDNHILWAAMMGYTIEQLFRLSQEIIVEKNRNALFGEAYNLSYTDVYDFLSAGNKMRLKKWQIKLHINHVENAYPWDQPVDESHWDEIADYCCNDVIATEKVWDANQEDWLAREILADLAELTVNDTTNSCTTKIIVGNDKNPQQQFIYTDLSTIYPGYEFNQTGIDRKRYTTDKIPTGKSIYRGKDPGEGGYAIGYPGIYFNVALLDVASMHPHSAIKLKIFGEKYTKRFQELVDARIAIKHGDYDKARTMLGGKLSKYLDDPKQAKKLANALKTAINSVYGLTSASFPNKLKDPRNVDNIVAKYGALFMINLEEEVQKRGYQVVHIKTDSIKIADATPEIIQFCMEYGKKYGFTFEHEATYEKMCIVNDAVYIAKYNDGDHEYELTTGEKIMTPWTATGKQFKVPYVFKTLFSKSPIKFEDMCETFSTSSALYLDFGTEENHDYRFVGKIGEFTPIKPNCGGGVLLREQDGKYNAAAGTKKQGKIPKGEIDTYFWMESETVKILGKEKDIDRSYYSYLVDEAVETISQFGDITQFTN